MRILVIHGPNLNLLGRREPEIYGSMTLEEINQKISEYADNKNLQVATIQSNHEGEIIDRLQEADENYDGLVINPGGYTHTSIAIRDTVAGLKIPVVEVHISNIFNREEFRSKSVISPAANGLISGLGYQVYLLGIEALIWMIGDR